MAQKIVRAFVRFVFESYLVFQRLIAWIVFALACGSASIAQAQATFTSVAVSPLSGVVASGGTMTATFSGTVKATSTYDSVEFLDLYEGAALLATRTYPMTFNQYDTPINTVRTITISTTLNIGVHRLRLRARTYNGTSSDTAEYVVTVSAAANGATYVSQSVPTKMIIGQTYSVSVTMKNSGTTQWTAGGSQPYGLGSQNPADNFIWRTQNRVPLTTSVNKDASKAFTFSVTPPSTPGFYNFQWKMVQDYVEWFGSSSPNVQVEVVYPSPTALFTSPASGATFTASGATATVSFSGTVGPGSGASLSSVQLRENGVAFKSGTSTPISGSKALAPGDHTIELYVKDSRNMTTSVFRTVSVKPPPPVAAVASPSNGSVIPTTTGSANVTISGTGTPVSPATIKEIYIFVDGTQTASGTTGSLSITRTLGAGPHTLGVEVVDSFGTRSVRANSSITVQAPKPDVSLTSPANYSYFVAYGSTAAVPVSGNATVVGGSAITLLELLNAGTKIDEKPNVSAYSNTLNLAPGLHSLSLRATNALGGVNTSATAYLQVVAGVDGNSADFLSQDVPTTMRSGQPYTVTVRMLNNGTTTWSEGDKYRLGAQNPQDNRTWGGRAYLKSNVPPGQIGEITFEVTAPAQPGTYHFQWKMVRDDDAWFGDASTNVPVTVTTGAGPLATLTATPSNVRVSGTQTATITFAGSGSRSGGTVTQLDLLQDSGQGYSATPVRTITGSLSTLNLNTTLSLGAGVYGFKLRATDSSGVPTDSNAVLINITNSTLLGSVSGVRTNSLGAPELFGWTCQPGNAAGLAYKVLLDAPTLQAGGQLLAEGLANVATELDNAAVQGQCATPGAGHHFVLNLTTYTAAYAGRALYVYAETATGSANVSLPCADNSCTMPGTLRVALTTPMNGDRVVSPNPAFLRMQTNSSAGTYDEVGFYVNGEWIPASADGATGAYSASKPGLAISATPYTVYAKLRQANMTMLSVAHQFTVVAAGTYKVTIATPANGATVTTGTAHTLGAVVEGAVQTVKFFANGSEVSGAAVNNNGTWNLSWTPAAAGSYTLLARSYDGTGVQLAQSDAVTVTAAATAGGDAPIPIIVDVPQLLNGEGGTLPGSVTVTNDGTASYTIPIKLPPGILGMVPNISLTYDSSNPTGFAGLGWNLAGISRIDRCGKVIATDGRGDGVRFISNIGSPNVFGGYSNQPADRLCIDGQRLILVNGSVANDTDYWADNAEYRTEVETFTRVTASVSNGKRSFKVETKDGRTSYYGETPDSYIEAVGRADGLAHRWYVSRSTDRSGNYLSYAYYEDSITAENHPASIRWGGNSAQGTPHFAKVAFTYEARKDPRKSYIAGSLVSENLRLTRIDTTTDTTDNGQGTWVTALSYTLAYDFSKTSGRSLLSSITACDASGCIPSTTFNWGDVNPSATKSFAPLGGVRTGPNLLALAGDLSGNGFNYVTSVRDTIAPADFNGDGKTDIIERFRVSGNGYQQRLYQSNGIGNDWNVSTPLSGVPGSAAILEIGDFDGDGLPDLMIADWAEGTSSLNNWRLCLATRRSGSAYVCDLPVVLPVGANGPYQPYVTTRLVKDFNGDGKDDLFIRSDNSQTRRAFQCLSNGVGFNCTDVTGTSDEKSMGDERKGETSSGNANTDIDGDGRVDSVQLSKCAWYMVEGETQSSWHCGSGAFGPDAGGITVFGEPERGAVRMFGGWNRFSNQQTGVLPQMASGSLTADLNADGYSDMVFGTTALDTSGGTSGFTGRMCLSRGNGGRECSTLPLSNQVNGVNRDHLVMTVGDFDGDGIHDVLRPLNDTWTEANATGYQLCRIGTDRDLGAIPLYQRCEAWSGPTFYGLPGQVAFELGAADLPSNAARSMFYGDFDGDGKQDILTYLTAASWQVHAATDQAKPNEALDRLVAVANGIGNVERIDYALPNDSSVYVSMVVRPDGQNAVGKLSYPNRPLVKAVHRSNGASGWRDTSYQYFRQALDTNGRGNLGFAQIVRVDAQRGTTDTSWSCLNFPFIGSECGSQTVSGSVVLSSNNNVWSVKQFSHSSGAMTSLPYLSASTLTRRDLLNLDLGKTVTSMAEPDAWGNVLDTTTVSSSDTNPGGWSVRRQMSYDNSSSSWRLGELRSATETRTNGFNTLARQTTYTYDTKGLRAGEIRESADGAQRLSTSYDRTTVNYGLVGKTILSWTDAGGAARTRTVSDIGYTSNGRFATSVKNAMGHVELHSFDARSGAVKSVVSANNLPTLTSSDGFGRVTSVLAPDGTITATTHKRCSGNCPAGATSVAIQETNRAGNVRVAVPVLQFADSAGRTVRTMTWGFDGRKIVTDIVYDELGRQHKVYWPRFGNETDALGTGTLQTLTTFDTLDRPLVIQTLDVTGQSVSTTNSWQGFSRTTTNGKSQQIKETQDVWGKAVSAVDANQKTTLFAFDAFGNLVQTTDPKNNVVAITYDAWGRRKQLKDPDLGLVTYDVDPVGQVWRQVSPKQRPTSKSTVMAYDGLGRMISRTAEDSTATWTYDVLAGQVNCATYKSCGQLVRSNTLAGVTTPDFRQEQSYDSLGRPDTTSTYLDVKYTTQIGYDAWGRMLRETHQRGTAMPKVYDRRYNGYGLLARIERAGSALWTATAEDAAGRVTNAALGNGLLVTRTYNANTGRIATGGLSLAAGGMLLQEGYSYDVLGNVSQRTQAWAATSFIENFDYDVLNRLKNATIVGHATQSFDYDDIGNLTSKTGVGSGNYVYPSSGANSVRPHAVSSIPGIGTFLYDDNGNMTSGAGRTVGWSSFDMPMTVSKGTESSRFYYGADHQRVKQVRSDGVTIWYVGAMEVEEFTSAPTVKTYLPFGLGVEIDKAGTTQLYFTHRDRIGSVVAISDENGNVAEQMAYDSWGKRRAEATPNTSDSIDGVIDNKGFTGHEMLDRLDLVHMNGRVYDPLVARFMSADPIIQAPEHSQSYNRYTYVWNNPTNLTDPTGFEAKMLSSIEIQNCAQSVGCQPNGTGTPPATPSSTSQQGPSLEGSGGGGKAAPASSANSGTPAGCRTGVDCGGNGNGYDQKDPLYHRYTVNSGICNEGTPGCTVENVATSVKKNAAPGSDGVTSLKDGDKTAIVFMGVSGGHVTHIVDDKNKRVLNITDSDHVFYNGLVIRSVVKDGGTVYVSSFGEGVNKPNLGWLPNALSKVGNLITAYPGFKFLDGRIQRDILNQSPQGQQILQQQQIRRLEGGYHGM